MARRPEVWGERAMAIRPSLPQGQGQPCNRPMSFKMAIGGCLANLCWLKDYQQDYDKRLTILRENERDNKKKKTKE